MPGPMCSIPSSFHIRCPVPYETLCLTHCVSHMTSLLDFVLASGQGTRTSSRIKKHAWSRRCQTRSPVRLSDLFVDFIFYFLEQIFIALFLIHAHTMPYGFLLNPNSLLFSGNSTVLSIRHIDCRVVVDESENRIAINCSALRCGCWCVYVGE